MPVPKLKKRGSALILNVDGIAIPGATAGKVLKAFDNGSGDVAFLPGDESGGGGTHGSGTLVARPASPTAGDSYVVTSEAGTGDEYQCLRDGVWTYLPGDRSRSPDQLDAMHWRLDEASGVYVSTGTASLDLTLTGSPTTRGGVSYSGHGALQADSTNAYAVGANGSTGIDAAPTALTISAWVRITSLSSSLQTVAWLVYNHDVTTPPYGIGLDLNNSGMRASLVKSGAYQSNDPPVGGALSLGTWHHAGMAYDGSLVTFYVDGVAVGTWTPTGSAALDLGSSSCWSVGAKYAVSPAEPIRGAIASTRVSATARPASWWREVYHRGIGAYLGS